MSEFSELLSRIIADKSVSVIELARYCDLDRSSMYKIVKGSRLPASLDSVYRMSSYLRLSPDEKNTFVNTYRMSQMGRDVFLRRQAVAEFLREPLIPLYDVYAEKEMLPPNVNEEERPEVRALNTKQEVVFELTHAFVREAARGETAEVFLLLNCGDEHVLRMMDFVARENPNLRFHHLIGLSSRTEISMEGDYNMNMLRQMLSFCSATDNYEARYLYAPYAGRMDPLNPMANTLITSDTVIQYSYSSGHGIMYTTKEMVQFFRHFYGRAEKDAMPAFNVTPSFMEHLRAVSSETKKKPVHSNYYTSDASMIVFLNKEQLAEVNDHKSERETEELYQIIEQGRRRILDGSISLFGSLSSLERFLEDGTSALVPQEKRNMVSPTERIAMVRKLAKYSKVIDLYLLKHSLSSTQIDMGLEQTSQHALLRYSRAKGESFFVEIDEPGICASFDDFLESLKEDTEMVYSKEEAAEKIRELADAYEKKLNH